MDVLLLNELLNYNPNTQLAPDDFIKEIYHVAEQYLSQDDVDKIKIAYEFAKKAHEGVFRSSWEPYIIHPIWATKHLMTLKPDLATIQACLMHDVIEDTDITWDEIQIIFGKDVKNLCEAMVKVWKVKYRGEERTLETWKKTFLAMANDLRVIFIKLADRCHNIQTLGFHKDPDKIKRIARETLDLHSSIAKRLWLWYFQTLLENGAYMHLEPENFKFVMDHMLALYTSDEHYVDLWMNRIKETLQTEWIDFIDVKWRLKSPFRVAQKVFDPIKPYDIYTIPDILAFRVIVPSVSDCYLVLWAIHAHYNPEVEKIKDFIARPLSNWYQSLHTRIFWLLPFQTEVQIRTPEMDYVSEYGVAAHFAYAESWSKQSFAKVKQWERIQKMQEVVKQYQTDFEWFKEQLNVELVEWYIYVYTPKWDALELPIWSTVLDFAFRVHTKVWYAFKWALVNGTIVPIDYELHTWDHITIQTRSNKILCTRSWLNYVKTSWAKQSINRYIKSLEKDKIIATSEWSISEKLLELWLPSLDSKDNPLRKQYENQWEWMMMKIHDKQLTAFTFIKSAYPNIIWSTPPVVRKVIKTEVNSSRIYIDQSHLFEYHLCPECNPITWQAIIAKSGKDWMKIHTLECSALKTINYDKLMEAHREWEEEWPYHVQFHFTVKNQSKVLIKILTIFAQLWVNIQSVDFPSQKSEFVTWSIVWEFPIPSKVTFVLKHLEKLEPHIEVKKTIITQP